ncbi:MAG: hypothetical protein ACTHN5_17000 [Phycisphaerae bacterium]
MLLELCMVASGKSEMGFDLELIAQRVMKLAEIATLEHVESLVGSQAGKLMEMAEEAGMASLEYGIDGMRG